MTESPKSMAAPINAMSVELQQQKPRARCEADRESVQVDLCGRQWLT